MKILIDNDGKGRYQSYTATVGLEIPHIFNSEVEAYGATEKEAMENLYQKVSEAYCCLDYKMDLLNEGLYSKETSNESK